MPTATQLSGLASYRKARSTVAELEKRELDALARIAELRRAADAAELRGDDDATDALQTELHQAEHDRDATATRRRHAVDALATARTQALGAGDGFELLSAQHPLLLLPVRLESRFAWEQAPGEWTFTAAPGASLSLLVRIFPDDIHLDAHEPELTDSEEELLIELAKRLDAARDFIDLDRAWGDAIRRAGPTRAGWLGELIASRQPRGRRPARQSRPVVARLLPDCWVAIAELDDGTVHIERSLPIREPLETGVSPDGIEWMTDFKAAREAGMAIVLSNLPSNLVEIRRLTVVGARGTLDPDDTAAALENLLSAHHYTDGLTLLSPGTPTNSLPGERAGFSSRPQPEELVPIERRRFLIGLRPDPLCSPGDETDGTWLATTLGMTTGPFQYVRGADAMTRNASQVVRALLATATRRHLTRLLANGIVEEPQLDAAIDFGIQFASATGPLPPLLIGNEPYGILPVLLRDEVHPPSATGAELLPVLDRLRSQWRAAADTLAWVGDPHGNPGDMLVRMLQRDAVARSIVFRPALGPQLATQAANTIDLGDVDARRAAAAATIGALGATNASAAPLIHALHFDFSPQLTAPIVERADADSSSPQRHEHYLPLIASLPPDRLLRHDYGDAERPLSLLYAIARLAMLERVDTLARVAHIAAGADPALWDDENVPTPEEDALGTPERRLQAPDPQDPLEKTVAFHLSEQGRDAAALSDERTALRWLATQDAATLEELTRASLTLLSHRLDPWYTALAVERLNEIRNSPTSQTGINSGAYGIVERIRFSPRQLESGAGDVYLDPFNGGYIHAPSAGQGAAAAVLRSIHLAHAEANHGDAFSIDLSSARVRTGLDLLEGIRDGRPLAALLGYRIERLLASEHLQRLIAPFRTTAPLVAHKLTPGTEPADAVAATNVVDGLTLLSDAGYDGTQLPSTSRLPARYALSGLTQDERDALDRVLTAAADAVDAVADLALAEGVYQSVQGNPVRAGAAADSLSGAPIPPAEPTVARSARTGIGVTHRILVLLGDDSSGRSGWLTTPRALAEPRLEAWARAVLPSPERIRLRARFVSETGKQLAQLDDLTLADLNQATLEPAVTELGGNALALGALDVVLQANPHETPQKSALELRLAALFELKRPSAAAGGEVQLIYERHPHWADQDWGLVETLEMARQLRVTVGHARPLNPDDMAMPGNPPVVASNAGELAVRASSAITMMAAVAGDLEALGKSRDSTAMRFALFAADQLGIPGAAPLTVADVEGDDDTAAAEQERRLRDLQRQVASTLAELARRQQALTAIPGGDSGAVLEAVFGEGFVVLPSLTPTEAALATFDQARRPTGADSAAALSWLAGVAPVRESVASFEAVLAYADALAAVDEDAPTMGLHIAQSGSRGERWVALPPVAGSNIPAGRVSLIAGTPTGNPPNGSLAGLLIDEWVEVVPNADETTSVAFHYDAPGATAPNVLLLGTPPQGIETWTAASAHAIVAEALDLAKIRLVDTDDLHGLGQLVPAFLTTENPAGDGISLDVEALTEAP